MNPTEFDVGVVVQPYPWNGMMIKTRKGYMNAKNGLNQRVARGAKVLYGKKARDILVIGRSYKV